MCAPSSPATFVANTQIDEEAEETTNVSRKMKKMKKSAQVPPCVMCIRWKLHARNSFVTCMFASRHQHIIIIIIISAIVVGVDGVAVSNDGCWVLIALPLCRTHTH